MVGLQTLLSKGDIYGNRLNLVINHDTKEMHFTGSYWASMGLVTEDLGIRKVNARYKELLGEGYVNVSQSYVQENHWGRN